MTIGKGADWGEVVSACDGGILPTGDLAIELGVNNREATHVGPWLRLPLDLMTVVAVDTQGQRHEHASPTWAIAGSRTRGDYFIVSSTSFVGGRRVFSRAHPNDGRLDWLAIEPGMTLRQRMAFHRRTRTETHLPHPFVRVGTGSTVYRSFARPVRIRFESGGPIDNVVEVNVTVRADATFTHIPTSY